MGGGVAWQVHNCNYTRLPGAESKRQKAVGRKQKAEIRATVVQTTDCRDGRMHSRSCRWITGEGRDFSVNLAFSSAVVILSVRENSTQWKPITLRLTQFVWPYFDAMSGMPAGPRLVPECLAPREPRSVTHTYKPQLHRSCE